MNTNHASVENCLASDILFVSKRCAYNLSAIIKIKLSDRAEIIVCVCGGLLFSLGGITRRART